MSDERDLYRFLAAVADGPYSGGWGQGLDAVSQDIALAAADWLRPGAGPKASPHSRCSTPAGGGCRVLDRKERRGDQNAWVAPLTRICDFFRFGPRCPFRK